VKSILFLLFIIFTLESNELSVINQALEKGLDKDRYWLKLLHFQNNKSTINNHNFFISSDGDINSTSELIQTIKIFKSEPNTICKYPARYKWLDSKLNLTLKKQNCLELDEFLKPNFKKLKIVFTSERYDSPASVFGHTMLKIESDEIPYVINYAAKIPNGTNSLNYIYNGLSGKFKSRYRLMPFSLKDYEYRSGEFRDLIEFSLNLNSDEIENIMLHFYEIKDTNENYYFLSHNCSSELIKLIDIAKYGSKLSKDFTHIVIPIDIIYNLEKYKYIESITNQNSKLKQFYEIISKLNVEEKKLLFKLVNSNYSVNKFAKENHFSKEKKALIVLAGVRYFEIKSTKNTLDKKSLYPYMKLINLEIKQTTKFNFDKNILLKKNPISNKFHKLYSAINYNLDGENEFILGYRYLYRNRFDLVDDMKKNGTVELFDIAMRKKDNKFSLEHLTILNLEAMPISNIFFKESINKIKLGIKRVFSDDKLYSYFNYGLGYRYRFSKNIDYQFYAKTGVYYHTKDIYLASLESSVEYNYNHIFISEFMVELNRYTNGSFHKNISLNNYIKLTSDKTINLDFKYKNQDVKSSEVKLFINYFF